MHYIADMSLAVVMTLILTAFLKCLYLKNLANNTYNVVLDLKVHSSRYKTKPVCKDQRLFPKVAFCTQKRLPNLEKKNSVYSQKVK